MLETIKSIESDSLNSVSDKNSKNNILELIYSESSARTPITSTQVDNIIPPIMLEWSDITYSISNKSEYGVKKVPILNGVSGYANPGELLVLMGSSGAGKTTLLNFLCNRISSVGKVEFSGKITANGSSIKTSKYTDSIGYVTQDDIMLPTMTCRETLEFAANLKVAGPQETRKKVVNDMLETLQITKAADIVIGSQTVKGISGGQKKRVAIGLELISNPSVLFLDEPTSGLDSYTAELVLDLLLREAEKGRTVITTLHQPSYSMFKKFTRLILMFEGKIVYSGPPKKSSKYFGTLGFEVPRHVNPPDYFMRILHVKSRENKTEEEKNHIEYLVAAYEENKSLFHTPFRDFYLELNDLPPLETFTSRYRPSYIDQFKYNLLRNFKNFVRDPFMFKIMIATGLFLIGFSDMLWNDIDTSHMGLTSRVGFISYVMITQLVNPVAPISLTCKLHTVPDEKNLYFKEEASGLYSLTPYFISKQMAILPYNIIFPVLTSIGVYWATDLDNNTEKFFLFSIFYTAFIIIICSFVGTSYGYLVGIVFPTTQEADLGSHVVLIPWIVFSGMFCTNTSFSFTSGWLKYLSVRSIQPFYYAFKLLMINEFFERDLDCADCRNDANCIPCEPLDTYGIDEDNFRVYLIVLIFIGFGVRIAAGLILYYKTARRKRF
jgi:ABC-type multidrug transport system ATPase subunit